MHHEPPVEQPDAEFPLLLTTGRRLESYNTGVQTGGYDSPLHNGETLDISPEDAARLGICDGVRVAISSRRGRVTAPARIEPGLRAGLVFMTLHFPDEVATNVLTIDVSDPQVGDGGIQGVRGARAAHCRRSSLDCMSGAREQQRVSHVNGAGPGAPASERVGECGGAKPHPNNGYQADYGGTEQRRASGDRRAAGAAAIVVGRRRARKSP